jgi:hypothetical protein
MTNVDLLGYVLIAFIIGICVYMYYDSDALQLKCIVSAVDGNKYCVRERDNVQKAADLLAKVTEKCKALVEYMGKKFPDNPDVQRLVKNFQPPQGHGNPAHQRIYRPYSENKGEKLAFCLNQQKTENNNLIDEHHLDVCLHYTSFPILRPNPVGHKSEFWQNFKFLLEKRQRGPYSAIPRDYKKKPREYCGWKIHDNPYYDSVIFTHPG